jgi:hypothetical protein
MLSGILGEIGYSARRLVRNPGLTLALLFTIALGLGSNVTVRGFIRGLTMRESPIAARGGVVSLFGRDRYRQTGPVSYEDYLALKADLASSKNSHSGVFEWIGAAQVSQRITELAGQSAIKSVAAVTPDLAGLLNLSPDGGVVISRRVRHGAGRQKAFDVGSNIRSRWTL